MHAKRSTVRLVALAGAAFVTMALAPLQAGARPAGLPASGVAANPALYEQCGRVFPDPLAYAPAPQPAPNESPYAKGNAICRPADFITYNEAMAGLEFLAAHPQMGRFVEIIDLNHPDFDPIMDRQLGDGLSAGLATPDPDEPGFGRDRTSLVVVRVTDEAIPDIGPALGQSKDHFTFPLSIHGIERAGVEGGLRAIEDLATWAAFEPTRRMMETIPGATDAEGLRNIPVAEILERTASYFLLANPDGWRRGDTDLGGPFYMRYNGNGMDLNRDYPEIGYTELLYTPWSEPESRATGRYLMDLKDRGARWTGGIDLHGMLISRAFSYTLIGGSQRPFDKNERVMRFVEKAFADAEDRLLWHPAIMSNDELPPCVYVDNGIPRESPPPCQPTTRMYGVQFGTIWDSIDYTVSGALGNWVDSPIGLGADGIDNEMSMSHLSNCGSGKCFERSFEQLHVDGNKSLIYAMLNYALQPPQRQFEFTGRAGYLVNPRRLQHGGAPVPTTPAGTQPQPSEHFVRGHAPPAPTTYEFEVAHDPSTYSGGIMGQVTFSNVQSVSPGAALTVTIEQRVDDAWVERGRYFNQSAAYLQAGAQVEVNFPSAGQYRLVVNGAAPSTVNGNIIFTSNPAWPDPGQVPYDVSNMDFFTELRPFLPDPAQLVPVDVDAVINGTIDLSALDTLVAVDDAFLPGWQPTGPTKAESLPATAYAEADLAALAGRVGQFARDGGNVVLTDDSLRALEWMGLVDEGAVQTRNVYAGHVAFTADAGETSTYDDPLAARVDRPGAAQGNNRRRQTTEPVPIGYKVPASGSTGHQPQWFVDREAWDAAGGRVVGTMETGSASRQRVALGELEVGLGRVRILGSLLPFPSDAFAHNYGLSSYGVTYTGFELTKNLFSWENPVPPPTTLPVPPPQTPDGAPSPGQPAPRLPAGATSAEVLRLWGTGRAETAADVSRRTFAPGVAVAYVATGDDFADALGGGPAAGTRGAPILLATRDRLPEATRAELARLQPRRVILLGGAAALSEEVRQAVEAAAGVSSSRIAGPTRYETAARVSSAHFLPGAPVAYVATGERFPDALSGGPAAGIQGGPVLLVSRTAVPAEVEAELRRLAPRRIVVLGGDAAVSAEVERRLAEIAGVTVERRRGEDRYHTATEVARVAWPDGAGVVFVATGERFPDALAGVPPAISAGAPVLLVRGGDVPARTMTELRRLRPSRIFVLGGTAAVSRQVEEALRAYPAG